MRSNRALAAFVVFVVGWMAVSSRGADAIFAGKYSDGNLTLDLSPAADGYAGTITLHGKQFPATARTSGQGLVGTFTSGSNSFPFTASPGADMLTLSTGSVTYKLKQLSPPANPLAAQAAPANPLAANPTASDAPAGYTVITTTGSGKSIATHKPDVTKLNDALIATFSDLATYFGNRPVLGSAYQDAHDPTSGGATFGVTFNGHPARGIVSCKLHDGASISVVFLRADAPKADWEKLMAQTAKQPGTAVAAVPDPGIPLKEYDYPDGTGSIELADGWTTQAQSESAACVITGPANQAVLLHSSVNVNTPDSMAVKQRQQMLQMQASNAAYFKRIGLPPPIPLPPLMVAPLTDPETALPTMFDQFSKSNEFNHGPTLTFGKILSSQVLPCQLPGGKRAVITFTYTQTLNGQSTPDREQADIITSPLNAAWMWYCSYGLIAPDATFDHDLPIMLAMAKSEKANQERTQQVVDAKIAQTNQMTQQIAEEGARQRQASFDQFQQDQKTRQNIHDQQMAQTQAGYDAHNQQFNDYELQRSRNAADFNESIIGTRTVYDTVTGESGYANLTDVNGVVDSLNQAALDPNRFVQIPLRDQLYPLPGK